MKRPIENQGYMIGLYNFKMNSQQFLALQKLLSVVDVNERMIVLYNQVTYKLRSCGCEVKEDK